MGSNSIDLSKSLHQSDPYYGAASSYGNSTSLKSRFQIPRAIFESCQHSPIKSILDYGTGKGGLISVLKNIDEFRGIDIQGYDPAIEEFSTKPIKKYDVTTCIDVLEHIPRKEIIDVIQDIKNLTEGFLFFAIDLLPARKNLSDGRNAHLLLAPADWWCQQISSQFLFTRFIQAGETPSGEQYPCHLCGWASNNRSSYKSANKFLDSIRILQRRWIYHAHSGGVTFEE